MARDFAAVHKAEANPITTPGIYEYGAPGARRARTYSQVIAQSTRGMEAGAAMTATPQGPNGPKVEDRQAPDWRGHYLGKVFNPFAKADDQNGDDQAFRTVAKVSNVSDELGVVFGWAIVCTEKGEPYYDLNIDWDGPYAGERVPEHIPEPTMLKAALDFMDTPDRPGNEMHAGPEVGKFVCAWPLTAEIAKAMGITCERTGLMVGYKPPSDVLAKFRSGAYTAFSIEGCRTDCEEHD